jgi:Cu/Ag efflux protein CusF
MFSCLTAALCAAPAILAQAPAKPAEPPKGEVTLTSVEATATVKAIDQATREVTLTLADGSDHTFIAGDAVKNLAQVQKGDLVKVSYTEGIAYEVKKSAQGTAVATTTAVKGASPGAKPAGTITQRTTATVTITAIDMAVPSVTFKGPQGNTLTVRVQHPEKLKEVHVGDTVELTYTEAIAMKLEKASKN